MVSEISGSLSYFSDRSEKKSDRLPVKIIIFHPFNTDKEQILLNTFHSFFLITLKAIKPLFLHCINLEAYGLQSGSIFRVSEIAPGTLRVQFPLKNTAYPGGL